MSKNVAKLVWDGGAVRIPSEMGTPRADQLQGSPYEQLSELGGRVCYDSVGTGRSSVEYHKHIKEVGHLSVYEHAHMTVKVMIPLSHLASIFLNRPGIWVVPRLESFRVTFNPRSILDWDAWSDAMGIDDLIVKDGDYKVGHILSYHAEQAYPMMVPPRQREKAHVDWIRARSRKVEGVGEEEMWVSMFMVGSRGFSHELVRHGDRTAISQRSTRFVNEAESDWIDHPLVQEYIGTKALSDNGDDRSNAKNFDDAITLLKNQSKALYVNVVETLQPWLASKGVDKLTARKQARGAARGYLGNALMTELIFSASVAQWKRMLRMRACAAADAEIRAVFVQALGALKESRYADHFLGFTEVPAADGLGHVVIESVGVRT